MNKRLAVAFTVLALGGCGGWSTVESSHTIEGEYSVDLPVGWVRANLGGGRLVITRDGIGLQRIVITKQSLDQAFPKTKKTAEETALPSELAELQIAEMKAEGEMLANMSVLENLPAAVSGAQGFMLHVRYKTPKGLPIEQIVYGVIRKSEYFLIRFEAPGIYYFQRDRGDFEAVVKSIVFT